VITSSLLRNLSRTIESLLTNLGFLVTIIVGGDSLNKIFSHKKEQDARYLFLFPIE
jgi:DMSO reductase anchor subunit